MDLIVVATWVCMALSLWGTYLNVKLDRKGFVYWAIANSFWVWYNLTLNSYALMVQFAIYFVLAIMGWYSWKANNTGDKVYELRSALVRMRGLLVEDNCRGCGASGSDCDGCTTDARIAFIDHALSEAKE